MCNSKSTSYLIPRLPWSFYYIHEDVLPWVNKYWLYQQFNANEKCLPRKKIKLSSYRKHTTECSANPLIACGNYKTRYLINTAPRYNTQMSCILATYRITQFILKIWNSLQEYTVMFIRKLLFCIVWSEDVFSGIRVLHPLKRRDISSCTIYVGYFSQH